MKALRRASVPATFNIHVYANESATIYEPICAQIRRNMCTADELVKAPLSSEEYWLQLKAADVVLLLYEPSRYRNQTSAVLIDALAAGCFPIVSEGTWLADIVRSTGFGAIVSLDSNVGDTVATVLKAGLPKEITAEVKQLLQFHTQENFFALLTSALRESAV
ncbi:hypothetical protein HY346_03025 [Candidatus Microgenomates bacterium]|nr:hypothetical protein [Candidatus Microgenomates bacterium]